MYETALKKRTGAGGFTYKQLITGAPVIEIDQAGMVLLVNGQDRLAAARKAIGS